MKNNNTYNKNNFKVPDGYFNSIEASILEKINKAEITQDDYFTIPDDYFDSVEDTVFSKLNLNTKTQKKIGFLNTFSFSKIIPIAIAASFVLFIALLFYNNNTLNFNDIAQNDIELWFESNIQDMDSYLITDVYNDISLDGAYLLEENDLLNYLEGIDSDSIIDEL